MLTFKKVLIEDFMSISFLEFDFEKGVHSVVGENGAGKTQLLVALIQGLFNKNPKSDTDKLEDTYNKVTEQPYTITIFFEQNNNNYCVINDRKTNKISIIENNIDISPKGIKNQLALIENIIGMSYTVFSAFYYLSTTTLKNIFDISNEDNLVYKFFDIDTIKFVEKKLKALQKEYKKEYQLLQTTVNSLEKQLDTFSSFDILDEGELVNKKSVLQESLISLQSSSLSKKRTMLHNKIEEIDKHISELYQEFSSLDNIKNYLKKQITQFNSGVCPVCGAEVAGKTEELEKEYKDVLSKQKQLKKEKDTLIEEKDKLNEIYEKVDNEFVEKEKTIKQKINNIDSKLLLYKQDLSKYERLKNNIAEIEEQKSVLEEKIIEIKNKLAFISVALQVIKSNAITQEYLQNFIVLLNSKIAEISKYLDFNISIVVKNKKGKIVFSFFEDSVEKTLNSLSSGEKTRVALVVLFSIFETLQILAQSKINIIVLDELLGVLDYKGVEMLKKLLDNYRSKLSVYVVLHHKEIADKYFDSIIEVKKQEKLTQITISS